MKKLSASTLTEVLVALTIITLISGLFFALIIRVGNYHQNRQQIMVQQVLFELEQEAGTYFYLDDELLEYEDFYVQKTVKPYKDIPHVWEIKLEAFTLSDKTIATHKALVQEQQLMEQ